MKRNMRGRSSVDGEASAFATPAEPGRQLSWRSRLRRYARRLARSERGATIVEFAIICFPFFLLLMGIFQVGLLYFEEEVFQTAVTNASRLILTGQASSGGYTQAQFKQAVCNDLPGFMSCSNVAVDVRPYGSFSATTFYKPVDSKGNYSPSAATYSIGGSKTIVVVSAFIVQPVLFPIMNPFMSNVGNGQILISASATFRNEPWSS